MADSRPSRTARSSDRVASLESVLRTEELYRRPFRPPEHEKENRALVTLAQALADSPRTILQTLADTILEVVGAGSAGISLLTGDETRFHWPAIAGAWHAHIGGGTPRDFGPCGDVLDRNTPLLFTHPERRYTYLLPVPAPIEECLLVPFHVDGRAVGTIWAVAHDTRRTFDAEDMRQLVSLGKFASSAHQIGTILEALEQRGETLRHRQTDLSQHVTELQTVNVGIQDSRRAALNLMEDAVQSSQAVEALNAELRESEARYRTLFDLVPVAVYSCDRGGVIQNFNRRATELWGRKPVAEDTGDRFCGSFKLLRPDGSVLPHEQSPTAQVVNGARSAVRDAEVVIERPDGSKMTVVMNIRPQKNQHGDVIGAISCFYDITERKQSEEALRDSDRRKDEFLAMLSHELRNPLAPILISLEILRRTKKVDETDGLNQPRVDALNVLMRQVGQMVRLVDDLLDAGRINQGKITLRRERVDVSSVVQQAVEAARPLCERLRHELTIALPPEPVYLNADRVRLAQIVGNLLNNACKFTEPEGHIWLTVERENASGADGMDTESHTRADHIVIRVRDTGMGIAAHQIEQIFDMFTQADTSLERALGGLGIGLTLVKTLTEMHGGTVTASSPGAGQGSEFVIRLPVVEETDVRASTPTPAGPAAATPLRIVVVDDNLDSADMIAMLLTSSGHETYTAHDGVAAVEAASRLDPDVMLLDIGLPGLNGYEAARRIREQRGDTGRPLLVALTGWGREEDRRRSQEAGFDAHVVKPVDADTLGKLLVEFGFGAGNKDVRPRASR